MSDMKLLGGLRTVCVSFELFSFDKYINIAKEIVGLIQETVPGVKKILSPGGRNSTKMIIWSTI